MIKIQNSPRLLLTMMILSGLVLSCDQHQPAEGVVATVNGTSITQEEVAVASRGIAGGHEGVISEEKANILEGIIVQELAYQQATKLGLDTDSAYQAELRGMEAQVNAFKRKKLSELFLRQELARKITVSDAEAQKYFDENVARLRTEIKVWHILSRNENTINKAQAELAQGLPFEVVAAKQFPNLPASGQKPWDQGYLQMNLMPKIWQDKVYNMKIGEISDIIRGPNKRFWIIKLIDKRENKDLTFEQVKPTIIDILKAEKTQQIRDKTIQELRESARIVYVK